MIAKMHRLHHLFLSSRVRVIGLFLLVFGAGIFFASNALADSSASSNTERLVTIHDGSREVNVVTRGATVGDALKQADVSVAEKDIVEPMVSAKLVAKSYHVNIFRARPVLIVDGKTKISIMTAEQTPRLIMKQAKMNLYDEDEAVFERVDDVLESGGAGLKLVVKRAVPFNLNLYGKEFVARTQAKTVKGMMREKNIRLGANDGVSVPENTPITENMLVKIWRDGKQTITVEESIARPIEEIKDADKPVGTREVSAAGADGKKNVTYEIDMKGGVEVSRTVIASVTTLEPVKQVVRVGTKFIAGNGLTKSKGVFHNVDSKGVIHRETYYDLPMAVVMRNCGAGGAYTVRSDGAKIDASGYVIVAAHLARYPRCSVVETSLGLGKVYDTGGFTSSHPDGFDLATDWSNNDGI